MPTVQNYNVWPSAAGCGTINQDGVFVLLRQEYN